MMMFAAAALRANFRAVNAARPVDTSSIKQTQTVSAFSISVSIPEIRALNPSRFSMSATTMRDAIVEPAQARDAEHRFSKFPRINIHHFICRRCTVDLPSS